jgi:hypothetical protein
MQATALAAATHFWIVIEYVVAHRGKSGPGNQIDMARGSSFLGLETGQFLGTLLLEGLENEARCL